MFGGSITGPITMKLTEIINAWIKEKGFNLTDENEIAGITFWCLPTDSVDYWMMCEIDGKILVSDGKTELNLASPTFFLDLENVLNTRLSDFDFETPRSLI